MAVRRAGRGPIWWDAQGEELSSSHDATKKPTGKSAAKGGKQQGRSQDMGSALRSVYQRTVEEDVPGEMMDLLGKLG